MRKLRNLWVSCSHSTCIPGHTFSLPLMEGYLLLAFSPLICICHVLWKLKRCVIRTQDSSSIYSFNQLMNQRIIHMGREEGRVEHGIRHVQDSQTEHLWRCLSNPDWEPGRIGVPSSSVPILSWIDSNQPFMPTTWQCHRWPPQSTIILRLHFIWPVSSHLKVN